MNIIRLVNVHNEADILPYNLEHYINQGIYTLVVDNASTDGSSDILKRYLGKGILEIKLVFTDHFDRELLFDEISKLANKYEPDWVIFADCDEFLEPLDKSFSNLVDLINAADKEGSNLIQFHNCEFWMTPEDDYTIDNPLERMKYYSYFDSNRYKIFKFYKGFSLVPKRGHAPTFPKNIPIKLSKYKGVSRHYKFRNLNQARYKIKRVVPEENKPDFGFHYLKFGDEEKWFIINPDKLTKYNEDRNWNLERKFDGNRMSNEELCAYLNLKNMDELKKWFEKRNTLK